MNTHIDAPTETVIHRFQCRHIHTDGRRCGSPSLRHELFCYFHHTSRKALSKQQLELRHQFQDQQQARRASFDLPIPEDRSAIQASIGEIIRRLATNQLDPRRAGLLLYGLQIASINLPPRQPATDPAETVEEVVLDPEHGLIALPQDFQNRPNHEKTLEEILLEDWAHQRALEAEEDATTAAKQDDEDEYAILDTLQAVAITAGASSSTGSFTVGQAGGPGGRLWSAGVEHEVPPSEARPLSLPNPNPPVPRSSQPPCDEWGRHLRLPDPSLLFPIPSCLFPASSSSARQYPDAVVPPHARRVVPPHRHLDRLAPQPGGLAQ